MKKVTFLILLVSALLAVQTLKAQTKTESSSLCFDKGSKVVNVQVGLGSTLYGFGYKSTLPPVSISYEQGIADGKFGVGAYLARSSAKYEDNKDYWKFSYTIIGGRGDYHFYTTDKIDTYGGLMLGYNVVSSKWTGQENEYNFKANTSSVAYSFFVGGRYYFSEKVGASAELGYGVAWLNLGLAFKF